MRRQPLVLVGVALLSIVLLAGCLGGGPTETATPSGLGAALADASSGAAALAVDDCRAQSATFPLPSEGFSLPPGFETKSYEADPSGETIKLHGVAVECDPDGTGEVVREVWAAFAVEPSEPFRDGSVDAYHVAIGGATTSTTLYEAYEAWGLPHVGLGSVALAFEDVQAAGELGQAHASIRGTSAGLNTTVAGGAEAREPTTTRVFGVDGGEVVGAFDRTWGERDVRGPGHAQVDLNTTPPEPNRFEGEGVHAAGFTQGLRNVTDLPTLSRSTTSPPDSWLQIGNDAGRTGAMDHHGPATNDTALEVQLPGTPVIQPAVVDEEVYIGTVGNSAGPDAADFGVWRIDLSTGEVEKLLDLEDEVPWRVRPDQAVVQRGDEMVALDLASGEERWTVKPLPESPHPWRRYLPTATVGDTMYLPFLVYSQTGEATARAGQGSVPVTGGVSAVDLSAGEIRWTWTRDPASEEGIQGPGGLEDEPSDRRVNDVRVSADEDGVYPYIRVDYGETEGDCSAECVLVDVDRTQYELWALDSQGQFLWKRNDTDRKSAGVYTPPTGWQEPTLGPLAEEWSTFTGGKPLVTPESVHIRLDAFERLNPATGEVLWTSPAGRSDQLKAQGAYGMGIRGDALVALSPQTVTRIDAHTGSIDWQRTNPSDDRLYSVVPAAVDPDTAYVPFIPSADDGDVGLDAVDLETGEVHWSWRPTYEDTSGTWIPSFPAYGPGFAVWPTKDGTVHVVGETGASLGTPDVAASTTYPEPGEEVSVDLSGTEPGAFGEATRYKADWGDGTTTGWQEDPVLTHRYPEAGDVDARFRVANDANQTSSTTKTFHVGEDPPPDPNFAQKAAQKALAPGNVDITFGVLGLFVAVTGGAIGVARRQHKRSRLQQELDALEQGFEETRDDPGECEAFLDTRKGRARSLALDGKLNEEQAGIVSSRAEELRRELRRGAVEEEFGFLPHELVRKARTMLEDGEVSELEAEAFLAALEEVDFLREEQEALVRERIEDWFARDAGGGAG